MVYNAERKLFGAIATWEGYTVGFSYKPLWKLLIDKGMKKKDLRELVGLHPATIAKMGKDEYVTMEVLSKLCEYFNCRIEDIIEYVPADR